jgi:hypothetical protein
MAGDGLTHSLRALLTDDAVEVFERAYVDRHADLRRDRGRIPLRDCSNAACKARVAMGIPHCCEECRAADLADDTAGGIRIEPHEHSLKCQARQTERGVTL